MNWNPYQPTAKQPWNFQRVWTLHRRSSFGATWEELQRDLADGPVQSIDRILNGSTRSNGIPDNFHPMNQVLGDSAVASNRPERMAAWWIYQMVFSPDPLRERLTLMWHSHFATSNAKVDNFGMMREQNDIFRQCATRNFEDLLSPTLKHPAILKWLDGDKNRAGKANENLGRETLELFTLGVGNYTESDVKNASRALTGWTVRENQFQQRDDWHDDQPKTILGQSGNFNGDDLIRITASHPASAKRLAWRLCNEFLSPAVIDDETIQSLADVLTQNELNIQIAVETILRSELFFSDANLKQRIIEPESFIVGSIRALDIFDPPASTIVLGDWLEQMGRKLFYPPNVGGWPGGPAWLNSRTIIARANFGAALANGRLRGNSVPPDFTGLADTHQHHHSVQETIAFYCELLTGTKNLQQVKEILTNATRISPNKENIVQHAIPLILASPHAQLS